MAQRIRNLGAAGVSSSESTSAGEEGEKVPAGPRQELLQKRIHSSTATFIKENVIGLPKLPTEEEVQAKQQRRRREVEARLEAEKEASRQAEERALQIINRKSREQDSPRSTPQRSSNSGPFSHSSQTPTHNRKQTEEVTFFFIYI